jgi:hypothetical protein
LVKKSCFTLESERRSERDEDNQRNECVCEDEKERIRISSCCVSVLTRWTETHDVEEIYVE